MHVFRIIILITGIASITGCGQKGDLYLPEGQTVVVKEVLIP